MERFAHHNLCSDNFEKSKIEKFIKDCRFKQVFYLPISGYNGINLVSTDGVPKEFDCKMSLIEIIESIDLEKSNEVVLKNSEMNDKWNQMIVNLRILNAPNVITPGFKCVMHYLGNEYEVMFGKFKNKKMLRSKESDIVIVKSKIPVINDKTREFFNKRVLFRSNDSTIGFGLIDSVK